MSNTHHLSLGKLRKRVIDTRRFRTERDFEKDLELLAKRVAEAIIIHGDVLIEVSALIKK